MHDCKLAEQYCDSIYAESQRQQSRGMGQLPISLQLQLQSRTTSRDQTVATADASKIYLMLAQVSRCIASVYMCSVSAEFVQACKLLHFQDVSVVDSDCICAGILAVTA